MTAYDVCMYVSNGMAWFMAGVLSTILVRKETREVARLRH